MKSFLTLFTIVSALMLMSCSNVEQDLSPVGPEMQKISAPEASGTYQYLTSFNSIPVESYIVMTGEKAIEVTVGGRGWTDYIHHIYVLLEYNSQTEPSANRLVYLERPRSATFQIDGVQTTDLKDVKVYCYEPSMDKPIQYPYHPQQLFNDIAIQWSANHKEIEILIQDNIDILGDTFVEITTDENSYVLFIGMLQNSNISIPNYGDPEVINVKIYSLQK